MLKINYNDTLTIFKTTIPVLVSHLNYGNHLGYDALLSIIQDARMKWLKKNGMEETSISDTIGYMIVDVSVSYKSEGFYGDDLDVEFYVPELPKKRFNILYKVTNQRTNKVVAIAETGHIFYDFKFKKVVSAPEIFTQIVTLPEPLEVS